MNGLMHIALRSATGIRRLSTALVTVIAIGSATQASAYNQIVVFGDSLSDAGNVFAATGGLIPGSPYASGHFSNGPTWVEDLAGRLGIPLSPSALGGTDFAYGGAVTGPPFTSSFPTLTQQSAGYLSAVGGVANPNALYVVWGGGNDVLSGSITGSATNLSNVVSSLAAAGAVSFLVPNLPNIGLTPQAIAGGPAQVAGATFLSGTYNMQLANAMQTLRTTLGVNISSVDVWGFLNGVVANPGSLGLTNVNTNCYVGGTIGGGTVCATPDQYLFWDGIHPTRVAHQALADFAYTVVPVPSAILLLGSALGVLGWTRRKAA